MIGQVELRQHPEWRFYFRAPSSSGVAESYDSNAWARINPAATGAMTTLVDRLRKYIQLTGATHVKFDTGEWQAPYSTETLRYFYGNYAWAQNPASPNALIFGDGNAGGLYETGLSSNFNWCRYQWLAIKQLCDAAIAMGAKTMINMAYTFVTAGSSYAQDPTLTALSRVGSEIRGGGGKWLLTSCLDGVLYEISFVSSQGFGSGASSAYANPGAFCPLSSWVAYVRSAAEVTWRGLPVEVVYGFWTPGQTGNGTTLNGRLHLDQRASVLQRKRYFAFGIGSCLLAASYGQRNVSFMCQVPEKESTQENGELSYHWPGFEKWALGGPVRPWEWVMGNAATGGLARAYYENGVVLVNPNANANSLADPTGVTYNYLLDSDCFDLVYETFYPTGTLLTIPPGGAFILEYRVPFLTEADL
jgi:hypothetical protein